MALSADPDVVWALKALRDARRIGNYRGAEDYYNGVHDLRFATDKFRNVFGDMLRRVADNLCPAVVDSVADRLKVTGFQETGLAAGGSSSVETAPGVVVQPSGVGDKAWEIWQRNRMDIRAPETHREALLTGDGFAFVEEISGEAVIWSLPAWQCAVSYDPTRPGVLRRACRLWQDEDTGQVHLDLFYPDRTERWVTKGAKRSTSGSYAPQEFIGYIPSPPVYDAGELEPDATSADGSTVPNTLGVVPIVHFPNRAYHCYGVSELKDVVPLQDALNKAVCDMLVAMEFSAFRQRWATGIEAGDVDPNTGKPTHPPFDYGVDRLLTSDDPNTRFGSFDSTDLTQYVEVQENLRSEIARVSGTPLHYLFITRGDFPSGEAMKSAEARFTRKVENRQEHFGNGWEDVISLALRLEGETVAKPSDLSTVWESASPLAPEAGEPTPTAVTATERI